MDALFETSPPRPLTGPGVHDGAAVLPRARADVHDVVGGADGLLVVLDHDDRVAQVAQTLEGPDEPLVVPLVQADGGLVQHVEDADETAPDLAGQPDPLRLAARKGAGRPGQRQVVEPDVEQELHPLPNLFEHPVGDHVLAIGQLERPHRLHGGLDGEAAELVDVPAADGHGQRLGLETGPPAVRAGHLAHVLLDLLAGPVGLGLAVAPLQPRHDPLEVGVVGAGAVEPVLVGDPDGPVARAVEDQLLVLGLELLPRGLEGEPAELGHARLQSGEVLAPRPRPRCQRALGQGQRVVGHDELGVHLEPGAETRATGAGPVGRVEGEVARRRLLEADAAMGAGQVLGERDGLVLVARRAVAPAGVAGGTPRAVHHQHFGRASGELQGRLDGLGQALADVVAADEAVDHHFDRVHLVAGEVDLGPVGQLEGDPVDPDPGEALLGQVVEQGAVLPLASPHHGRHHLETGAVGQLEHPVHDLLGGLARHGPSARRAVGMADAGVEQAEVVVDLSDRAHRRTRVARG